MRLTNRLTLVRLHLDRVLDNQGLVRIIKFRVQGRRDHVEASILRGSQGYGDEIDGEGANR